MPKFSEKSKRILTSCHPDIVLVMNHTIEVVDITILYGIRGEKEQNRLYRMGFSKNMFPNSRHNAIPPKLSEAVDIAPYPINWKDTDKFYYTAGIVLGIASELGITLRWGGDWDRDHDLHDQTFMDLGHFELFLS